VEGERQEEVRRDRKWGDGRTTYVSTVSTYAKDTPRIRSNQSSTPCSFPSVSD
jgi:hypothetical protein